jgi:hypothetical protein
MTTQTAANIATALGANTTFEEILVYGGFGLNYVHGSAQYRELDATGLDTGMRPIAFADVITTPSGKMALIRAAVPMQDDWAVTPGNLWVKAKEISTGTLPAAFNVSGL